MSVTANNVFSDLVPKKDGDNLFQDLIPKPAATSAGESGLDALKQGALESAKAATIFAAPIARLFGENAEDSTFGLAQRLGEAAQSYQPNPQSLGAKIAAFAGGLAPKVGEAVIDPAVLGAESGINRAATGVEAGESTPQALAAGGVEGLANYAGARIPVGGKTLGSTFRRAAAAGITLPVAQTAAEHEIDPRLQPNALPTLGDIAQSVAMYAVPGALHHVVRAAPAAPEDAASHLTPEQARLIGLEQSDNMFKDLVPVTIDAERAPATEDEAAERVQQPIEVQEGAPAENIELKAAGLDKARQELEDAAKTKQTENAIQALNQRVAEDREPPSTEGIEADPGKMTNVELAEDPNAGLRANPASPEGRGIDVQEIPQEQLTGEAEGGNAAEAAQDQQDHALRAQLSKPVEQMTPEELKQAVSTDPLTLLPNRRAFESKERQAPANAYSAIDLVGFKNLNDTVGHAAGDQMLQAWGKILRRSGLDAARTGGDEFTVRGETQDQLQQAMGRLKEQAAQVKLDLTGPDGKTVTRGLDFRYGIGDTPRLADEAQIRNRDPGRQAAPAGAGGSDGRTDTSGEQVPGDQVREVGTEAGAVERGAPQAEGSGPEVTPAAGGKLSRRIFRNDRRGPANFVVPETPEFADNKTGDLSRFPDNAAKRGIKPLPIRLPVGVAKGDHRGYGVEHMAQNGDAYPEREPPQYTDDRAENYARHIAALARTGTEGYIEGDKVILRSPRMGEALVLQEREDTNGPYYGVVTSVPAERSRWGYPAWTGRSQAPVTTLSPRAAPEPTPGQNMGRPDRLSPEPQTEHYELPPKDGPGQGGKKSVGDGEGQTVTSLRTALGKGLGLSKVNRLEQAGALKLHERAADIPYKQGDKPSELEGIQGYFDGKTMHLAADGIRPGDELPVAIHEAIHQVQEDPRIRDDLRGQFKRLVAKRDPAAMRAVLRIPEDTPADQYHDEGVAYLAEEVAKTEPAQRAKTFSQQALDLARHYYNAIRARFYSSEFYQAAKKVGVNLELSPKDIVAVGRLQLERGAKGEGPGGLMPPGDRTPRRPGESQDDYAKRLLGSSKQEIQSAMDEARRQQKVGRANFKAMLAQRARAVDTADAAFDGARRVFDRRGDETNLKSIDEWETGQQVRDPMARQFFDTMEKAFEQRITRIREFAPDALQNLIEHYMPHLWEDSGKAAKWYQNTAAKRPMEGNKSFLKQRTWGTIKEGMASGLKPVSTNPVDLALAKLGQMDKFIAFHEFRKDLNDRGWLQEMRAGERVPDGYGRIEDPAFQKAGGLQGYYAAPELIAKDVNRYLEPGLYKYGAWRSFRSLENVLLSARLGLSAFHAGFTTSDTAFSHLGLAFRAAVDGDLSGAAKQFAQTVASPVMSPLEGRKLFQQFYGETAADADTSAVLHALELGGARGRMMDASAHMGAYEALGRSYRQGDLKGTAWHALPGILEGTQRWITHYLVPWQKMASRATLMKFELDRYAEQLGKQKGDYAGIVDAMHPDALKQISGKIVQDVDDRLGQLAYDNLFLNRIAKDVAQATIQSVGWNIGTARTILGGVADTRRLFDPEKLVAPLDKAGTITDARMPRVTGRLSYLIAMNFAVAAMGGISQYLMSGKKPESLKDLYFPRTGRLNPDGSEERISFPTYIKDEYAIATHPLQTVEHKLHPALSMVAELLTNKDFFGTEIRNPDDPWTIQGEQFGKYLASGFEPYAFENEQRAQSAGASTAASLRPFVGVTEAPSDISRTKFQQFVAENGTRGYGGFERTPEQAEEGERVHQAEDALRTGREPDYTGMDDRDIEKADREGRISKPELSFMRLGIEDKLRAYDMATPEERRTYRLREHLLHGRLDESIDHLPRDERAPVIKRLREIEGSAP